MYFVGVITINVYVNMGLPAKRDGTEMIQAEEEAHDPATIHLQTYIYKER